MWRRVADVGPVNDLAWDTKKAALSSKAAWSASRRRRPLSSGGGAAASPMDGDRIVVDAGGGGDLRLSARMTLDVTRRAATGTQYSRACVVARAAWPSSATRHKAGGRIRGKGRQQPGDTPPAVLFTAATSQSRAATALRSTFPAISARAGNVLA
jgi:hypothetical protein